jgi:hypothetical protein
LGLARWLTALGRGTPTPFSVFGAWCCLNLGNHSIFSAVGLALWDHRVSTRHDELSTSKKNLTRQTTALRRGKTNGGREGSGSPRRGRGMMKLDETPINQSFESQVMFHRVSTRQDEIATSKNGTWHGFSRASARLPNPILSVVESGTVFPALAHHHELIFNRSLNLATLICNSPRQRLV